MRLLLLALLIFLLLLLLHLIRIHLLHRLLRLLLLALLIFLLLLLHLIRIHLLHHLLRLLLLAILFLLPPPAAPPPSPSPRLYCTVPPYVQAVMREPLIKTRCGKIKFSASQDSTAELEPQNQPALNVQNSLTSISLQRSLLKLVRV
jgi:hypothetical protein